MPLLKADGTILFASAEDFIKEYESNLSQAGLLLDVAPGGSWKLRLRRSFTLVIGGTVESLPIMAEPVFEGNGKLGLQVLLDPMVDRELRLLLSRLKRANPSMVQEPTPLAPIPEPADEEDSAPSWPDMSPTPIAPLPELEIPRKAVEPPSAPSAPASIPRMQAARPTADGEVPVLEITGTLLSQGVTGEFLNAQPLPLTAEALKEVPLIRLVASICASQLPMALRLRIDDQPMTFEFNMRGNLVRFTTPQSPLELLERLEKDGKLDRKRKEKVIEILGDSITDQGIITLLVERRLLRPRDYWMAVRSQAIDGLRRVSRHKTLPYHLRTEVITRRTGIPFGMLILPWMDIALRDLPTDDLDRILAPHWHHYPVMRKDPPWPLHSLGLDPDAQSFFEEILDGCVDLNHVRKTSPLGINRTKRMFVTLIAIGLMEILDEPRATSTTQSATAQLEEELARLERVSRFDQLGVHWSDHPSVYNAALERVKVEFGPDSKWQRFHPETLPTCQRIIALAADAAKYLKNQIQRKEHRDLQATKFQQQVAAHLLFKQAELMLLRKEHRQARETLEVALEMDPKPEYQDLLRKT